MTDEPATVLVLGGRGFVGSAIVAEAERRGWITWSVDKDDYSAFTGRACDVLTNANGNSRKFLARENPPLDFDLSVRSVERSLYDFRFNQYVHLSSCDVYSDVRNPAANEETSDIDIARISPYGFHKYLAEQIVRHSTSRWTIFRMAGFVGSGLWKNSIHDLLHGHPLRVHPDSRYQYLNTKDFARLLFDMLNGGTMERQITNIAGDGLMSLREVAALIPGCRFLSDKSLPREHYEISIRKLKRHLVVPKTVHTIRDFIREQTVERGAT